MRLLTQHIRHTCERVGSGHKTTSEVVSGKHAGDWGATPNENLRVSFIMSIWKLESLKPLIVPE